ncbi:MAG: TRAP transporter substrate-binding protein DctP [Deltaproteobacteria bacterium]|nr:TRAP transporter substrate-binding protein DctP [Deltaproteobacteria bacterium]
MRNRMKKCCVLLVAAMAVAGVIISGVSSVCAAPIVWKSSGHGPATDPSQIYHDKACEAITKASGGRLVVKAFVGGSVVPATKELDAVADNVLQMAYTCPMYNLDKWKAAGLISSRPGGLPGEALRTWFNFGGGADLMNKMMEKYDIMTFPGALSPLPEEVFLHSKKKVMKPEDMKGLKIRSAGDGGEIMSRMGASVVFMPGGELYEGMQRGTIDAFEYSTLASNWDMHFNEIAKYVIISASRAPSDPQCFFVNKKAWAKLPDDLKQLVQDVIDKWTQAEHEYLTYKSIEAVKKFTDYGCDVYKLPKEVENALSAEAVKFYEEKAAKESPVYVEILKSMNSFRDAYAAAK